MPAQTDAKTVLILVQTKRRPSHPAEAAVRTRRQVHAHPVTPRRANEEGALGPQLVLLPQRQQRTPGPRRRVDVDARQADVADETRAVRAPRQLVRLPWVPGS